MTGTAIARLEPAQSSQLPQLVQDALGYAHAGVASNTARAYGSDWADFTSWCASVEALSLPAAATTVALYLTARAQTHTVSTLARRLAAINAAHRDAGQPPPKSPDLAKVWAGIRRTHGRAPKKKRALLTADLLKVLKKLPDNLQGRRDRAVLLIGFAGFLRRCEAAALVLDAPGAESHPIRVAFAPGGLLLEIGRAKGDQEGRGVTLAVPYGKRACPVAALQAWLKAADITSGPVFRRIDRWGRMGPDALTDRAIADVVKRAVGRAGYDAEFFAGHSLRRGGITSAAEGGADPAALMRHARHARFETTLGYIEDAGRFGKSAAGKTGL